MSFKTNQSDNPKDHAQALESYIVQLKDACHDEIKLVSDPRAKALFETAAEVLNGLEKAFSDYQSENEGAWIKDENRIPLQ